MKIGMVGLDTSHCIAFTKILNDPDYEYYLPGFEVVAAYPGGSELFSLSRDRVQGFTRDLEMHYDITLYDRVETLVQDVDALFLESADGRQHVQQFQRMAVGKPVFVDKPLAVSTVDAREMIRVARRTQTPLMSCSSLRYAAGIADAVHTGNQVVSCEAFGPAPVLDDYPGLFWYGIHSAEILFTLMKGGCERVRCMSFRDMDVLVGEWWDGRLGMVRGTRFEKGDFGCVVHTAEGTEAKLAQSTPPYYYLMLQQVVEFFKTGKSPIDIEDTFGIIAFLEAADRSKARGGVPLDVESL